MQKLKKDLVSMHSQKPGFLHFFNNSKSKQNKNNPKQVLVDT